MIKQRADYTFKYNLNQGRHGWLRLTPAYSIKLVNELLQYKSNYEDRPLSILDPFCGTATTGVVAAENGFDCTLLDINPFLVWLGNTKSKNYSEIQINNLKEKINILLQELTNNNERNWIPPMYNIERWWASNTLIILSNLRALIVKYFGEPQQENSSNLVWIAFARLCVETSSADFNHISLSFKEYTVSHNLELIKDLFIQIFIAISSSALINLNGNANVILSDARLMNVEHKFDLVITSPPYPNRISYIRELRPYMYWLKFLTDGAQAGDIDWKAIGGTWGTATSKLHYWTQYNTTLPNILLDVCRKIATEENANAQTMALYVHKFFDDLMTHFINLRQCLNKGAQLNYILGNSSFYGNFVQSDIITTEILNYIGYKDVRSKVIRKRNCNKGLFEYIITAQF